MSVQSVVGKQKGLGKSSSGRSWAALCEPHHPWGHSTASWQPGPNNLCTSAPSTAPGGSEVPPFRFGAQGSGGNSWEDPSVAGSGGATHQG